jgi:hypothetical protein
MRLAETWLDADCGARLMSTPSSRTRSAGAGGSTLLLLALGALLAGSWSCLNRTHQRRLDSRPAPKPERLQTWESEGGRPWPEAEPGGEANATAPAFGPRE